MKIDFYWKYWWLSSKLQLASGSQLQIIFLSNVPPSTPSQFWGVVVVVAKHDSRITDIIFPSRKIVAHAQPHTPNSSYIINTLTVTFFFFFFSKYLNDVFVVWPEWTFVRFCPLGRLSDWMNKDTLALDWFITSSVTTTQVQGARGSSFFSDLERETSRLIASAFRPQLPHCVSQCTGTQS